MDNQAKIEVANIGSQSRVQVAKIQAEVDRDLHDTKERNDMDKKAADYYIDRKNREAEANLKKEEKEKSTGTSTTSSDLKRAAQKL